MLPVRLTIGKTNDRFYPLQPYPNTHSSVPSSPSSHLNSKDNDKGCLYADYWLRENQLAVEVFRNYLNPNLPANKPLFQVGQDWGQPLPCLEVLQVESDRLRQLNFCFNGDSRSERLRQRYQLADSLALQPIT